MNIFACTDSLDFGLGSFIHWSVSVSDPATIVYSSKIKSSYIPQQQASFDRQFLRDLLTRNLLLLSLPVKRRAARVN
jgi:hypothetical protein